MKPQRTQRGIAATEPNKNYKAISVKVFENCRGNPLWLPILRAATEGRPYIQKRS